MHRYLRIVKHLLLGKFRKYVFSVLPVMPLAWVFFFSDVNFIQRTFVLQENLFQDAHKNLRNLRFFFISLNGFLFAKEK